MCKFFFAIVSPVNLNRCMNNRQMDTTSRNVPGNAQASGTNRPTDRPADGQNLLWRFEETSITKKDDHDVIQGIRAKSLWVIIYSVVTAGESESVHCHYKFQPEPQSGEKRNDIFLNRGEESEQGRRIGCEEKWHKVDAFSSFLLNATFPLIKTGKKIMKK